MPWATLRPALRLCFLWTCFDKKKFLLLFLQRDEATGRRSCPPRVEKLPHPIRNYFVTPLEQLRVHVVFKTNGSDHITTNLAHPPRVRRPAVVRLPHPAFPPDLASSLVALTLCRTTIPTPLKGKARVLLALFDVSRRLNCRLCFRHRSHYSRSLNLLCCSGRCDWLLRAK